MNPYSHTIFKTVVHVTSLVAGCIVNHILPLFVCVLYTKTKKCHSVEWHHDISPLKV